MINELLKFDYSKVGENVMMFKFLRIRCLCGMIME